MYAISCCIGPHYNGIWLPWMPSKGLISFSLNSLCPTLNAQQRVNFFQSGDALYDILHHHYCDGPLLNSLDPGRCGCNLKLIIIFKFIYITDILSISCEIALRWVPQDHQLWLVNIGSINRLVSSGSKQIPEPMLSNFYDAISLPIWLHQATMS